MLFGTAGAVIGAAGVFWVVGATVGACARTAWRMNVKGQGAWQVVGSARWGHARPGVALVCALALGLALLLDWYLGEPPVRLHPVVWMGRYLGWAGPHIAPLTTADPRPRAQNAVLSGWARSRGAPGPVP